MASQIPWKYLVLCVNSFNRKRRIISVVPWKPQQKYSLLFPSYFFILSISLRVAQLHSNCRGGRCVVSLSVDAINVPTPTVYTKQLLLFFSVNVIRIWLAVCSSSTKLCPSKVCLIKFCTLLVGTYYVWVCWLTFFANGNAINLCPIKLFMSFAPLKRVFQIII